MLLMVVPVVFGAGLGDGVEPLLEEVDEGGGLLAPDEEVEGEELLEPAGAGFKAAGIAVRVLLGKEAAPPQPVMTAIPALNIALRTKTGTERIL